LQLPEENRTDRIADAGWNGRESGIVTAAFLFNIGQGVLRPSLPLYLRDIFAANYRMVTLIPVVFGAGKWAANLPTGYLLDRLGRRRLMVTGLLVIAACDVASTAIADYITFLVARACAGGGWAMFATVATTALVSRAESRGRTISVLLMAETLGLLVGTAAGGALYTHGRPTSPFLFEAGCMLIAAAAVGWFRVPQTPPRRVTSSHRKTKTQLGTVPSFILMCCSNATLAGIQTGVMVFLFPLYLAERAAMSPEKVGYLVAVGVVGRLTALWLAGRIRHQRARISMLALGLVSFGLLLGTFVIVKGSVLFTVWSLLMGGTGGFVAGLPTTIIGDRVDPSRHGAAVAWLRTATDAGMLVGPLVMGQLADALDLTAPFVLAGIISCALATACYRQALTTA
jgi:predicted MFS family arabinose efflux permease